MIVEAPVAGVWFAVEGAVADEHLYCLAVFWFAVLHEVLDDDVFPELCARDGSNSDSREETAHWRWTGSWFSRAQAEGRSLYDIEIYPALRGANG